MTSLSAIGAGSVLTLPGVDEPTPAAQYMRQVLELMQSRGIGFEEAWTSAINRIQAPQGEGGHVEDQGIAALVSEERALLEENRPYWQASYERRPPTTRERATYTVGAMRRIEGGPRGVAAKRAA